MGAGRRPAVGHQDATRSAWCSSSGETVITMVVRPAPVGASRSAITRLGVRVDRRRRLDQDQDLRVEAPAPEPVRPAAAGPRTARARARRSRPASRRAAPSKTSSAAAVCSAASAWLRRQPAVRVDGRLQGSGEHRLAAVADHDLLADGGQRYVGEIDRCPELTPQLLPGELALPASSRRSSASRWRSSACRAARPLSPSSMSRLTGSYSVGR